MLWCRTRVNVVFEVAKSARVVVKDCIRAEGAKTGVIYSLLDTVPEVNHASK